MASDGIQPTITMHSKTDCPFCDEARAFLTANSIPFAEVKHDDPARRQALYDSLGLADKARTVPQVIMTVDGEHMLIGGAAALRVSGIASLFHALPTVHVPPAPSQRIQDGAAGDIVEAVEGSSCCE